MKNTTNCALKKEAYNRLYTYRVGKEIERSPGCTLR
jgi:hypothetical protein